MPITRKKLEGAEAALRKSAERTEQLGERRNALVRQAVAEGWTHRQLAEAIGHTRSRISQLAPARTTPTEGKP
jgi:ribosome-binding protein aMBF1 (putative translation factor)